MAIVTINNLSKMYGNRLNLVNALNDVSFTIEKGEFVGVMGPSGAGKTTLLNMISAIDKPTQGSVSVNQKNLFKFSENQLAKFRRREIGFIFQDFNLLEALTVEENIVLPLAVDKMPLAMIETRLKRFASMLGLNSLLKRYPHEISTGQRQRVACARAMITQPTLLLADEPTGSLDSKSATELLQYLTQINQQSQTSIMLVTHDTFTASFCQRIIFIKDGQIFSEIRRQGTRQDFFNQIIDMQATIGGGGRFNALADGH